MNLNLIKYFLLMLFSRYIWTYDCPSKCTCKRNIQKSLSNYVKLKCGESEKIKELDEIDLLNIAGDIEQLNLSDNLLTVFSPKFQLIALQKLNLSRNRLKILSKDQFIEIPNLRRLDISGNNISHIDYNAFTNLRKLDRLKLNQNKISSLIMGTFDPLISLLQLDISNNPLICNCALLWFHEWCKKRTKLKLVQNPTCNNGRPLRKLRNLEQDCKSFSSGLSMVNLKPSESQFVFEGDSLKLECRTPMITESFNGSKIEWTWMNSNPTLQFPDILIKTEELKSAELIYSSLNISKIDRNHTGTWNCSYISENGNFSKGIMVVVITTDTEFCPISETTDNKGSYTWPQTIINNTVGMTCQSLNLSLHISQQKAFYYCSELGKWENLNTSSCSYISETTKILQQFSQTNTSVLESAGYFRNYTSNLKLFKDVMDLAFAVETIENYLKSFPNEELGGILVDVIDNLMELPQEYINEANIREQVCAKLINASESLAGLSSSHQLHKTNIALEEFLVNKAGFTGMKCTWYLNPDIRPDLSCVTNSQVDTSGTNGRIIEASITIPETLFHQMDKEENYKILISMHTNNKLFPTNKSADLKEDVTSAVVGTKLVNVAATNLSDPIYVMLRTPPTMAFEVTPFTPVWWDTSLEDGHGGWSSEGCEFTHEFQDHMVFSCNQFGYYGLFQDISHLQHTQVFVKFKFSHPAIYVGSFILLLSFLIAIMTYLLGYDMIQIPKKTKHSLINMWISICFLCFMYVVGIYQTEDVNICEIVGMLLHYFTLSSILWFCVGINCMYKRFSKNVIIELQDDELPSDQPIKKPILGLYLVGWGVALIVCGISAAINMREYSSPNHCFLRSGPALSALYIPFSILSLFIIVFCLLVRCAIYSVDANGHLSEGTQATENVDLDLLEPNFPITETVSVRSTSSKTSSSEIEDPEHAPITQLKAFMIFLLLYILTWLSCAFATVQPFHAGVYEEDLFSFSYGLLATILGMFTLFFYCIARADVRTQWGSMCRWLRRKKVCIRSRNISDTMPSVPQIQIQPLPPIPNVPVSEIHITSRSSSRSSNNTKTNSHNSNVLKVAATDLNGSFTDSQGTKINNVNLIVLHRQQYRNNPIPHIIENQTNAADVFYNPHQSTVARKFFKRQKRHLMKRNNLTARPREQSSDAGSVLSEPKQNRDNPMDQRIFGTNSKVNNTNIHVEQVRRTKQKNPNIFSDSTDFDSSKNVSVENIVMNAERLRNRELARHKTRKKSNKIEESPPSIENNMRSVSQQCTLEYSSENLSDSILDKTSLDKQLLPTEDNFLSPIRGAPGCLRRENSPMGNLSFATEDDLNYCNVNDVKDKEYFKDMYPAVSRRNAKDVTLDEPSNLSLDSASALVNGSPRVYVNPSHDLHFTKRIESSRASSVSVSDLDELYQQIRRGPKFKNLHSKAYVNDSNVVYSPCLSDSEVTSYVTDPRYHHRTASSNDNLSDNVETTV